jgi:hypothetical protein
VEVPRRTGVRNSWRVHTFRIAGQKRIDN